MGADVSPLESAHEAPEGGVAAGGSEGGVGVAFVVDAEVGWASVLCLCTLCCNCPALPGWQGCCLLLPVRI